LNKIIILIFFLINTLWANIGTNGDLKVLKELGLDPSFISDSELVSIYNEYSSKSKISYFRNILKKSSLNAQIVRAEIENENLHDAVFFIPMIESSFVNQTRGKNSPAGLWQIIPDTAKHLKLRNDEFIDERLDLIKSTDAASLYLRRYYKKFDNKWYLSILAYNSGEGRVIEAITRASIDRYLELNPNRNSGLFRSYQRSLDDYQRTKRGVSSLYGIYGELQGMEVPFNFEYLVQNNKQKQYLPESTVTYLKRIVVFSMLSNRDLFDDIKKSPYKLEKVKLPKGVSLKSVASAIAFSSSELEKMNKHIRKQVLPKDSKANFYIPKSKLEIYNKKIASIKPISEKKEIQAKKETQTKKSVDKKVVDSKKSDKKKVLIYKVKKGDSFESIAKVYNMSVKKLKSDNKKKSNLINIGDSIEIYK
jgi:membrane-bound lytic murein transglycosylase D